MSSSIKKNKILTLIGALLILFAVFTVVFLLIMTNGGETKTSGGESNDSLAALVCQSGGREDGFFKSEKANHITNEIKATYDSEKYDKLYYSYEGSYRSTEIAKEDTIMHTEYDIYMGENNLPLNTLSPSYSVTKDKFHLTLIADDEGDFNRVTAVFFYVDDEDVERFKNFSMSEMKSYYEAKDFKCSEVK